MTEPDTLQVEAFPEPGGISPAMVVTGVAALVIVVAAYALFPSLGFLPSGTNQALLFRGCLAGVVVGLVIGPRLPLFWTGILAPLGAAVGFTLVRPGIDSPSLGLALASIVIAVLVALGAGWLSLQGARRLVGIVGLLLVAVGFLWTLGLTPGPYREPLDGFRASYAADRAPGTYSFDGFVYLRTYYLMKHGASFYDAYAQAYHGEAGQDASNPRLLSSPFMFREPVLFIFWKWLPGVSGMTVYWSFVALALAGMVVAYWLARRFVAPAPALFSVVALASYLTFPLVDSTWWTFSEYYGGVLGTATVFLLVTRRWLPAAAVLTAAVATRELMLYLVPLYLLAWLLTSSRREHLVALGVAIVGPTVVLLTHWILAPVEGGGGSAGVAAWLNGGFGRLVDALVFSVEAVPGGHAVFLAIPLLAFLGAFLVREVRLRIVLAATVIVPLVCLFVFSSGIWGYYWGAIAQPLFIALAPLVFVRWFPSWREREPVVEYPAPPKIWVVLPAYNEAASIGELIGAVGAVMTACEQPYEVVVVDDGSHDGTGDIARAAGGSASVTVLVNEQNLGLGGAIRRGLEHAAGEAGSDDVVVTMDADLTQDPAYIPDLIASYRRGADVVIASRFRRGSRVVGVPAGRRITTLGARLVMGILLPIEGVRDYSCGFRLYRAQTLRAALERLDDQFVRQRGFACMVEIIGKLRERARFAEVPFVLRYDAKRSPSSMRIGRTVRAYFAVVADVRRLELLRGDP